MAVPKFVPTRPTDVVRSYSSPPWREDPWMADRPAEIDGRQPEGARLGTPSPDGGYALKLAATFHGGLILRSGEHEDDAIAGGSAIAMKRAGLFGRAPVIHDLRVGLGIWGFLSDDPPAELVDLRTEWFEEVHQAHHYFELRRIVDAAPDDVLRRPHEEILRRSAEDWRSCLDLTA